MTRESILSLQDKQEIADKYTNAYFTQDELATQYMVSRRTIQRALIEMGVKQYNTKKPRYVTQEEEDILTEVKKRGLTAITLCQLLAKPRFLNSRVVCSFLSTLDAQSFTDILSIVDYERMKKTAAGQTQVSPNKRAANE